MGGVLTWGRWRSNLLQVAALGLCLGLAAPGAAAPREFTFEELNGVYPDRSFQTPPVTWGLFQVALQSPRFTALLYRNRLQAAPLGDGRHWIAAEVEASGHGRLIADIDVAGMATRREGDAVAPRQTLALEGVAVVERQPDGYAITVVEAPPSLVVQIRSGLSDSLVAWCAGSTALAWAGVECGGLERLLTRVAVPLPKSGERFWLARQDLGEAYAVELDRYLAGVQSP
ncbi:MAG: hypothetical protein P1P84_09935 [Deferrisomatales bacterium]|nr:hypothetical protein [Deferrisomatales bacterium]